MKTEELKQIPGIGLKISGYLRGLGIRSVKDLKGKSPDRLYRRFCVQKGYTVDRCVLYVFRCAVYYASNTNHDPALLKWWNWKDK